MLRSVCAGACLEKERRADAHRELGTCCAPAVTTSRVAAGRVTQISSDHAHRRPAPPHPHPPPPHPSPHPAYSSRPGLRAAARASGSPPSPRAEPGTPLAAGSSSSSGSSIRGGTRAAASGSAAVCGGHLALDLVRTALPGLARLSAVHRWVAPLDGGAVTCCRRLAPLIFFQ